MVVLNVVGIMKINHFSSRSVLNALIKGMYKYKGCQRMQLLQKKAPRNACVLTKWLQLQTKILRNHCITLTTMTETKQQRSTL